MRVDRSARWMFAVFAAVAASFVAAGAVEQYASRHIDEASDAIINNATPSVEHLAAMRTEVRQVEFLLDDWIDAAAGGHPASSAELEAALRRFADEEHAYRALPPFDGEEALSGPVESAGQAFARAVQRAIVQVEAGAPLRARETLTMAVRPAASQTISAAQRVSQFHADMSSSLAASIKRDRSRALAVGYTLDGLCALFALLAAAGLHRYLSRGELLRANYAHLLERRADELESFAGRVAHDILSPLAAVRLSLELGHRLADGRVSEILARGERALARVEKLTDGLLAFARAGAQPAPGASAEVRPVVDGLVEEVREQALEVDAQLVVERLPDVWVACAPGILVSLLSNLVRNALKYVGDSPRRLITVRAAERGPCVRFEVEDTGPGVPAALAGRLFEPYVRGHHPGLPGLGLGLATVKRLAESHGGAAGVVSRPGEGATFWFELPRAAAGRSREPEPAMLRH